jgi:hypothetical protein
MDQYLRWLSILQIQPDSPEQAQAEQEARDAFKSWLANPDADLDRLIEPLKERGIPWEPLKQWQSEF